MLYLMLANDNMFKKIMKMAITLLVKKKIEQKKVRDAVWITSLT